MVCDGMGGHESGEVASRMAVDLFADRVTRLHSRLVRPGRKLSRLRAMAQDLVRECAEDANESIHFKGKREGEGEGPKSQMGTTLALVLVISDFAVVSHVGDSRVYRVRDWVIEQLTEDHTIVAEKKRHPADPRPARMRKYVTRALGTRARVEPEIRLVEVFPGDLFLLCSDGLTDVVADEEIVKVLQKFQDHLSKAIRYLIELANKRGGPDNVTVVVAEVVGDDDDDDDTDELPIING